MYCLKVIEGGESPLSWIVLVKSQYSSVTVRERQRYGLSAKLVKPWPRADVRVQRSPSDQAYTQETLKNANGLAIVCGQVSASSRNKAQTWAR